MGNGLSFAAVTPTVFLRAGDLQQCVKVTVRNCDDAPAQATVAVAVGGTTIETAMVAGPAAESTHEIFVPEVTGASEREFVLKHDGRVCDTRRVSWKSPRRWLVHVVQLSHHDVGYTNLASNVLRETDAFLDAAIDMVEHTRAYPDDAQFRIVCEQAWSVAHYLEHAAPHRAAAMRDLVKSGHVELTALFGNLVTELCGHETLARAVYTAFRLGREFGVPIVSAEHNDIPGFSWGLCVALTEAGIKIVCPGLPHYWSWCKPAMQHFWSQRAVFGHDGPGAFWWEAPSGKRLLFWCNNSGCGGDYHPSLPGLADALANLETTDYPYRVLRWPVLGGARDNSPYIEGYAQTIRDWNERWAYPRLVSSTNARFYEDFIRVVPDDLRVHRGELPGQDYPVGATSTAAATAVNRGNHVALPAAEALSTVAAALTDCPYPADELAEAWQDVLWHDEHTWGHHFPAGPAAAASEREKGVHAYRAAALAHDAATRAKARIADHVRLDAEGLHLVVFNTLPYARTALVRTPLREISNCGSTMVPVPPEDDPVGDGAFRGVPLHDRWPAHPSPEIVEGRFDLIDASTGRRIPWHIDDVDVYSPVPHAAQRNGLGQGRKRYGFMETPTGTCRDLVFRADDVPAGGYKTYRLVPRETAPEFAGTLAVSACAIENRFYRIVYDSASGQISSVFDKRAGVELLDGTAPYGFGDVIARRPDSDEVWSLEDVAVSTEALGGVGAVIRRVGRLHGHPVVCETITLYDGLDEVHVAVHGLKDPTPLLDVHVAFPFAVPTPRFRYEGVLSTLEPIADHFPGAYTDALTIQHWARVDSDGRSVLWSPLDAPVAELGGLHRGYVSPAHSCLVAERAQHPPLTAEDIDKGHIYSLIFNNNFGTNFAVSQHGPFLFRYVIRAGGTLSDGQSVRLGESAVTSLDTIFTKHARPRPLPPEVSLIAVEPPEVKLLALKRAEDGRGHILRLWNPSDANAATVVRIDSLTIAEARRTSLAEEDTDETLKHDGHSVYADVPARGVLSARLIAET
ncbi:MAG TPA: hypothetical protein PLO37_22570 [Candidatus Hydrogenedentes bacterium]|nr:hypothetical protein [Candidatus Hydrogenedentota bacterium]HPG69641.1 hypothetical protein [Candidatus Hydrogenedentota bacterium]